MKKNQMPLARPLAIAVWLAYSGTALAQLAAGTLPTAPSVVNGTVGITNPTATALQVTNTPGAIIQWGSFSIGSSASVSFQQGGGAGSAVLNRVTGGDPSRILGRLDSNGRVFLVNPNGILFGAGSVVDAQGLIASTRDIANSDFLSGNYLFQGTSPGQVVLEGGAQITTAARGPHGQVWLFAAKVAVQPGATVDAPDGQVVLAAGSQLQVSSGTLGNMVFNVATGSDSTLENLGSITAQRGGVGLFADSIAHGGTIATGGGSGEVLLMAARDITIADGAAIDASGGVDEAGGRIALNAGNRLKVGALAAVAADGGPLGGNGGQVDLVAHDLQVSPVASGMGNVRASARAAGAAHGEVRVMPRATPIDVQAGNGPVAVTLASDKDMYPAVAHLADGSAVVTWMGTAPGVIWNVTYATVYLQRIGADGQPAGPRVQVGSTTGNQSSPSVTALRDGGFLVAWSDGRSGRREIFTRAFGADGAPRAVESKLSTDAGDQDNIKLATLADGRLLATWSSRPTTYPLVVDIRGRILDAQGNATGTPFTVNLTGTADKGNQYRPEIAPLADGGFVVTYHAIPASGSFYADAYGRRFDRNGAAVGPEFTVAATAKDDWRITATGLLDGGFVVVWDTFDATTGGERLMARRFDARGAVVGGDFAIGYAPSGMGQSFAQVVSMADGGFAVTWMSYQNGTGMNNADVYAQRFAPNGQAVAAPRLVAGGIAAQSTPRIAATADNGYTVSWYSNQNAGNLDIYAERFGSAPQPAAVPAGVTGELRAAGYATAPGVSNGDVTAPVLVLPTPVVAPEPAPAPDPAPVVTPEPTPEPPPVAPASGKTESAHNAVRQVTPTGRPGFVLPGASPVFANKLVVTAVRNAAGEVVGYEVQQQKAAKTLK